MYRVFQNFTSYFIELHGVDPLKSLSKSFLKEFNENQLEVQYGMVKYFKRACTGVDNIL